MKQDQFRDSLMRHQQDNAILEPGTVRIIVIGGSAGSLPALRMITGEFPTDFGAAIFVVEHVSPHLPFNLPQFLSREGALPVQYAIDQEPIAPGRIYVAPPDEHVLLDRGRVRLQRSPKDPWNRPAINILFRSAAAAYGNSVAGVVLSGMLSDGTAGLWEIKNVGGIGIVVRPHHPGQGEARIRKPNSWLRHPPLRFVRATGQAATFVRSRVRATKWFFHAADHWSSGLRP